MEHTMETQQMREENQRLLEAVVEAEHGEELLRNTLRRITGILAEVGIVAVDAETSALRARDLIKSFRQQR